MSSEPALVLLVEDDHDTAAIERRWLELEGCEVRHFTNAEACLESLSECVPDLICLDLDLPGIGGLEALEKTLARYPRLPVMILTANADVEVVVAAMQGGAYDYLTKPVDRPRLTTSVRNVLERGRMATRLRALERDEGGEYEGIVGSSRVMRSLFSEMDRVSSSDIAVLLHGESGTGKELVAKALHGQSGRSDKPFVTVNCAAIPDSLMESEFFGHEKGAFTGANNTHHGYFEQAAGGTVFLDEVAELSLHLQPKLLRVLQEKHIRRVGGPRDIAVDFRLVCASHHDLWEAVQDGRFREDLFYRIAVFEMALPALRDRVGDIPLLVRWLLQKLAPEREISMHAGALAALLDYGFPGNVRELRNALHRALVVCRDDEIRVQDLPRRLWEAPSERGTRAPTAAAPDATPAVDERTMEDIERLALEAAMDKHAGNVSAVVRELGLGRTTVYRKLKKYGLR